VSTSDEGYDHFRDDTATERLALLHRYQENAPVSFQERYGGFHLMTKYADVYAGLVDTETFSSVDGAPIPRLPMPLLPEDLDPPLHRTYRHLVNHLFTPAAIAEYEPWMREVCRELLNGVESGASFDVVDTYARPLPQLVTMRVMGIPDTDLELIARTTTILVTEPPGSAALEPAGNELFAYLAGLIDAKRREDPPTGLIGTLITSEIDGVPLPDDELMSMTTTLLFGGLHTTTGAIAGAITWLADHPDQLRELQADLPLRPSVIDEIVRFTSPSTHLGRTATRDVDVRGCPIRKGDRVMMAVGAANHDPEAFARPDEIVLDRAPNPHVGFGMGPHRCVGSHLAKMQIRVAMEEFLRRFDEIEVSDRSGLRWAGGGARGLVAAPITARLRQDARMSGTST
jgi:cytochrome P450